MTEPLSNNSSPALLEKEIKTAGLGGKLSLEQVSQWTKIRQHYLKILKSGNFCFIPERYVSACIKAYSREMGLDDNETPERYKKGLKIQETFNSGNVTKIKKDFRTNKKFWSSKINEQNSERLKSILPLSIGMFVGVVGAIGFSYIEDNNRVSVHPAPTVNNNRSVRVSVLAPSPLRFSGSQK